MNQVSVPVPGRRLHRRSSAWLPLRSHREGSPAIADSQTGSRGNPLSGATAALLWPGDDSGDHPQRRLQLRQIRDCPVPAGRAAGSLAGFRDRHADRGDACVHADLDGRDPDRPRRRSEHRPGVPRAGGGVDRRDRRDGPGPEHGSSSIRFSSVLRPPSSGGRRHLRDFRCCGSASGARAPSPWAARSHEVNGLAGWQARVR